MQRNWINSAVLALSLSLVVNLAAQAQDRVLTLPQYMQLPGNGQQHQVDAYVALTRTPPCPPCTANSACKPCAPPWSLLSSTPAVLTQPPPPAQINQKYLLVYADGVTGGARFVAGKQYRFALRKLLQGHTELVIVSAIR